MSFSRANARPSSATGGRSTLTPHTTTPSFTAHDSDVNPRSVRPLPLSATSASSRSYAKRTTPRSARGNATGPPSARRTTGAASTVVGTGDPDSVEQEYIRNLQQQVYFLELEQKFLRERVERGDVIERGTDPRDSDQVPEAAPLEDHIKVLKLKFAKLQQEHKEELDATAKREEKLKGMVKTHPLIVQELDNEKTSLLKELDEHEAQRMNEREDWVRREVQLNKKIEQLTEALHEAESDNDRLRKDFAAASGQAALKEKNLEESVTTLKDKLTESEREVDRLVNSIGPLEVKVEQLEDENRELQTNDAKQVEELTNAVNAQLHLELKCKQLQSKADAADSYTKQLNEHNQRLEMRVREVEEQIKTTNRRHKDIVEDRERDKEERLELRRKTEQAVKAKKEAEVKMQKEQANADRLLVELNSVKREISIAKNDVQRSNEVLEQQRRKARALDDTNLRLAEEHTVITDNRDELRKRFEKLRTKYDSSKRQRIETEARNEELHRKLHQARLGLELVDNLKISDLKELYKGNIHAAGTIKGLIHNIEDAGGNDGGKVVKKKKDKKDKKKDKKKKKSEGDDKGARASAGPASGGSGAYPIA